MRKPCAVPVLWSLLLAPTLARAEVPDGYTLVFQSGFNPGVSIAGGNGCGDTRRLTGVDSVTGYSWDELPGNPSANYFNDVITDGPPDCCAQGCTATSKDECHTIEIASDLPQYDGSIGYGLRGVLIKDCSASSYSRIQYNIYDADPPVGDPLADLAAYYAEIDAILPNPEVITQQNGWLGILENYDTDNYAWKSALLLDCLGSGGCPQFYMYNCQWQVDCTEVQDNAVVPQANVPFKLRIWYRASTTDGLFKITYTCPSCTPPVPETTIGEFTGQTIDDGDLDVADIIKVSGTWGGVEMDWTELTLAAPSPGTGGAGAAAGSGGGGYGGTALGGSGGVGAGGRAGAAAMPAADDDGSCGCRLAGGSARRPWLGLVVLGWFGAIRRRKQTRTSRRFRPASQIGAPTAEAGSLYLMRRSGATAGGSVAAGKCCGSATRALRQRQTHANQPLHIALCAANLVPVAMRSKVVRVATILPQR